jgi:hypothetical protein
MGRPSGKDELILPKIFPIISTYNSARCCLNVSRSSCKIPAVSKYLNSYIIPEELYSIFILSIRPASWSWWMTMYLVLLAYISGPVSLLTNTKYYVFSFIVCTLLSKYIIKTQTTSWCAPFTFKLSWFIWTLLRGQYAAKLESNGDNEFPCFRPFEWEICQTNSCPQGICYAFLSGTFVLALPGACGSQTQSEYYIGFPPLLNHKLSSSL